MSTFAAAATLTVLSLVIFANPSFAQPDSIYRVPAGTRIRLTVDAEINSNVSSIGDTFIASVTKPVRVRETVVLPVGTLIEGRVSAVSRAAAAGQAGTLDVVFETLKISTATRRIDGVMISQIRAESSRTFNLLSVLGGLAAGAAIGALGSGKGALIGAGVGAAAGTGIALARKGKDVRIQKGQEFEIELKQEVVLPVMDY